MKHEADMLDNLPFARKELDRHFRQSKYLRQGHNDVTLHTDSGYLGNEAQGKGMPEATVKGVPIDSLYTGRILKTPSNDLKRGPSLVRPDED